MLVSLPSLSNIAGNNMARQIRKKSGTGIYHVMLRGINRQDIFEDDVITRTDPMIPCFSFYRRAHNGYGYSCNHVTFFRNEKSNYFTLLFPSKKVVDLGG